MEKLRASLEPSQSVLIISDLDVRERTSPFKQTALTFDLVRPVTESSLHLEKELRVLKLQTR